MSRQLFMGVMMIIYSLWFYEVDARHLANFVAAFREGGIFYEPLRNIPGYILTDLLTGTENPPDCCRLLSISFFTSFEALLRAEKSAKMQGGICWLKRRTKQCIHLGTFSHFPRPEAGIPSAKTIDQLHKNIATMEGQR